MNNYTVYIHIFPNKKVYIGITTQNPKRRWNNGKGYRNNEYMTNAIIKYGWNNIKHVILFDNLTKEQAEQKEIELIAQYKSNIKRYGYNILKGGNASDGLSEESLKKMAITTKKLWQNSEYREHMRNIHSGKKASSETKKKMSENNPKYWLGKHLPEETRKKISENNKGKIAWNKGTKGVMKSNQTSFKKGEIHSITKKVKCIETETVYDTINNASRKLNINATCIINVCKGKQITAGGFHWEYV